MSLSADQFVDRINLKRKVVRWRSSALLLILLLVLLIPSLQISKISDLLLMQKESKVARIYLSGIIDEDHARDAIINDLKDNDQVKALIIHINSPGGTLVGGETLYNSLRSLSDVKPVVSVMGNVAASGGYMAAIAADHIIAHAGTITGSIGVLLETMDLTELSSKIGVDMKSLKSGKFKDALSPFSKLNNESRSYLQDVIDNSYDYFVALVAERRGFNVEEARSKAEGKIYTGRQALENSLVDEIGGEKEALAWLKESHNIDAKLLDFQINKKSSFSFLNLFDSVEQKSSSVMAIWNGI